MKRSLAVLVLAFWLVPASGCLIAPVVPPPGALFSNIDAPLDVDFDETQLGSKVGKASTSSVLWLFAWGDASAAAAARDGGITTIRHADYEFLNVFLGVYSSYTTVVRGD